MGRIALVFVFKKFHYNVSWCALFEFSYLELLRCVVASYLLSNLGVGDHYFFRFLPFSLFHLFLGLPSFICWYSWCPTDPWGSVHFSSFSFPYVPETWSFQVLSFFWSFLDHFILSSVSSNLWVITSSKFSISVIILPNSQNFYSVFYRFLSFYWYFLLRYCYSGFL